MITDLVPNPETSPKSRALVAAGGRGGSYSGASRVNANIALWRPSNVSADAAILRDAKIVRARARDLERNHPYAQQAVRASRLGVIGRRLRYSCRPDHVFLGIDQDVAMRWGQDFERVWESYAHGIGFQVDAGRRLNFTQMMALIHDRDFTDGENLVATEWRPEAIWKTCFQVIDVDRLETKPGVPETAFLRSGVLLDNLGAPIGYHIREAHPSDISTLGINPMAWREIPRMTEWGRPMVLHTYEQLRPGQTRGMSAFASVISAMKMGAEYTETALQQAILQASYAAVLVSQQNYKEALEVIGQLPPDEAAKANIADLAEQNLEAAMTHHESIKLQFAGSQIPVLYPGQDLKLMTPGNGAASIGEFQSHSNKSYAAGTGTDPIMVSQDYSDVNYSSAKMAAASSFRTYEMRRERLIATNAIPMLACFAEEALMSGAVDMPKGLSVADFYAARDALIKGVFLTQGAPTLDPVKEATALQMKLTMGVGTMQDACAEEGLDYLDVLDQRAREAAEAAARGLMPFGMPPPLPLEEEMEEEPASDEDDAPVEAAQ